MTKKRKKIIKIPGTVEHGTSSSPDFPPSVVNPRGLFKVKRDHREPIQTKQKKIV